MKVLLVLLISKVGTFSGSYGIFIHTIVIMVRKEKQRKFNRRKSLCKLLLFGSTNLNVVKNRIVLEATMAYMKATKRFVRVTLLSAVVGAGSRFSGGDYWGVGSSGGFALETQYNTKCVVPLFGCVVVFFGGLIPYDPNEALLIKTFL